MSDEVPVEPGDEIPDRRVRDALICVAAALGLVMLFLHIFLPGVNGAFVLAGIPLSIGVAVRNGRRTGGGASSRDNLALIAKILIAVVISTVAAFAAYLAVLAWAMKDFVF